MTTTEQPAGPAGMRAAALDPAVTREAALDPAGPVTHAHSRPDACSVLSERDGISAFGTASEARFWVAVEQSGPWGRDAMTQSHLDAELGAALAAACQAAGGRLLLIRRPGLHADAHHRTSRRVLVATRLTGRPELLAGDVPEAADLLRLPFDALAGGDLDAVRAALPALVPSPEPALLVCTNARRDVCCAVRGRPVALQAAAERPGQVWECSHTGGHRFAPTAVLLPHGQTWARLSAELAVSALDAAARGQLPAELLGPVHDRGRSPLTTPAQAAESFVRQQIGEVDLTALSTEADSDADPDPDDGPAERVRSRVTHRDGRSWGVLATRTAAQGVRPDSCGKAPVPSWQWDCSLT